MIQQTISNLVSQMDANGDTFTFLHGDKDWQNIEADEQVFPATYLDMPIRYKTVTSKTGYKEKTYFLTALFLYKSELDDEPLRKYEIFELAEEAQRNFEILIDNDTDNIKSWTVGECYQVENLFNCNVSGVVMPFSVTLVNTDSVC
jgi:hypothetical protein